MSLPPPADGEAGAALVPPLEGDSCVVESVCEVERRLSPSRLSRRLLRSPRSSRRLLESPSDEERTELLDDCPASPRFSDRCESCHSPCSSRESCMLTGNVIMLVPFFSLTHAC